MRQLYKFSFMHSLEQDRIQLLAQGEHDFRCGWWLTRRLTRELLRSAQQWLTEQYAVQFNVPLPSQADVYAMYHDQAAERYEQHQLMNTVPPVDDVAETPLLARLDIGVEGHELKLTFFSHDTPEAFSLLSVNHFHQLLYILQSRADLMAWDIAPLVAPPEYALQ